MVALNISLILAHSRHVLQCYLILVKSHLIKKEVSRTVEDRSTIPSETLLSFFILEVALIQDEHTVAEAFQRAGFSAISISPNTTSVS